MGEKMNLEVEARATTDKILLLHIQMRFSKQQFSANARIYLNSWISEKKHFLSLVKLYTEKFKEIFCSSLPRNKFDWVFFKESDEKAFHKLKA